MPRYVFKCKKGHLFDDKLTFEEFDMLKSHPQSLFVLCTMENENGNPCDSDSEVQTQPTPFKFGF